MLRILNINKILCCLLLPFIVSCFSDTGTSQSKSASLTLKIELAPGQNATTNKLPIQFIVKLSNKIRASSFQRGSVSQQGTASNVVYAVEPTSNNKEFIIRVISVGSNGTIVPGIRANTLYTPSKTHFNTSDVVGPSVTYSLSNQKLKLVDSKITNEKSSDSEILLEDNNKVYFAANSSEYGRELFVKDLSTNQIQMVQEIQLNSLSTDPQMLYKVGDKLVVKTETTDIGDLFILDNLTYTKINNTEYTLSSILLHNSKLYFTTEDYKLYSYDGSNLVLLYNHGSDINIKKYIGNTSDRLVFSVNNDILSTDGNPASTNYIDITNSDWDSGLDLHQFAFNIGNELFAQIKFNGTHGLYKINNSSIELKQSGTRFAKLLEKKDSSNIYAFNYSNFRLARIDASNTSAISISSVGPAGESYVDCAISTSRYTYFTQFKNSNTELWLLRIASGDSTTQEVLKLGQSTGFGGFDIISTHSDGKDFCGFMHIANDRLIVPLRNTLVWNWYVEQEDATFSLIKDTPVTTEFIKYNYNSSADSYAFNNKVYLPFDDGVHGLEVWVYDANTKTFSILDDINLDEKSSNPNNFKMIANNLYFNAVSEIGNESYSIDSSGDLHFFANVNKSFEDTYFSDSFVMEIASNSLLFYRDNKNLSKFNITTDLKTLIDVSNFTEINEIKNIGGSTIASCRLNDNEYDLCKLDSSSFSRMNINFNSSGLSSNYIQLIDSSDDFLYFLADDDDHGIELWKTDGTQGGTALVKDYTPGSSMSFDYDFDVARIANNKLFVHSYWSDYPIISDGSSAGTVQVYDANYTYPDSIYKVVNNSSYLYYTQIDQNNNNFQLFKLDLNTNSTVVAKDLSYDTSLEQIELIADKILFTSYNDNKIYVYDHINNTNLSLLDANILIQYVNEPIYIKLDNSIVFVGQNGDGDWELWKTDGTLAGTSLIKNINPSGSSNPKSFYVHDNKVYFSAYTEDEGRELWVSDGTTAGTTRLTDIAKASLASDPLVLYVKDNKVYFSADDTLIGRQLWSLDLNP